MTTNRIHDDGRGGMGAVAVPTPKDARARLEDAIIALGQKAVYHWMTRGWTARDNALSRVLSGESPEVVAREFTR